MQIELLGCTSAGKSTLARHAVEAASRQGKKIVMGDDFVLQEFGFGFVRWRPARSLLLDCLAFPAAMQGWRRYRRFFSFALRVIFHSPSTTFQRFNIVRNVFKKVGIYEIIGRRAGREQIVLVDEGPLGAAHGLFVHTSSEPSMGDVAIFASLVPLPDVAVHVREDESLLVERTLARGHKRIPSSSRRDASLFVGHAVWMFDELSRQLCSTGKWLVVDGGRVVVTDPELLSSPRFDFIPRIIRATAGKVNSAEAGLSETANSRTPTECQKLYSAN